ncbi:MAG: DASS family sodium-coupled anion symporter [Phycisphaerales bacterium]|nr:DASS family sodium-coupled anion symporter [Phycisphaerales bacterium]
MRLRTAAIPSIKRIDLVSGPVLGLLAYLLLPAQYQDMSGDWAMFSHAGRATAALLMWMAVWWITEAVDLAVTALLPVAMLPMLGAGSIRDAAAPYASDLIFLFMGGFILALSMQRCGLDQRIALITLRLVGTKPINMVGGCMLATAMMGGFVSNTAKAAMMLPIGLSVIALVRQRSESSADSTVEQSNFAACVVLGIAYASSISGVATLIGTPPNTFLAAFIRDEIEQPYRREISFMQWLVIGVPLAAVFLPIAWLLLTRLLFPIRMKPVEGGGEHIVKSFAELGPMTRPQWATFIVFTMTALAWVFRPLLVKMQIGSGQSAIHPLMGLTDSGIAILGALALFIIPAGRKAAGAGGWGVMDWPTAARLPWGILILFGGGLSLAAAIERNGVAEFLGSLAHHAGVVGIPTIALVVLVVAGVVMFTEIASNTATATTLVPILAAIAPGLGVHSYLLIFPATVAASLAFMMPVGTPPNAMALGTGMVTMRQMLKAGFWLNVVAIALITVWTFLLIQPALVG